MSSRQAKSFALAAALAITVLVALGLASSAGADGETLQLTQGSAYDGAVVSFGGRQPLSASIDWGDGTTSSGSISGNRPNWTISGAHAYHAHGDFSITVTVTDDTDTTTHPATATVAPAPVSFTGSPAPAVQGQSGPHFVGSLVDADAGHPTSFYSGTIAWGDGATSPAQITATAAGFDIAGEHPYAKPGDYPASATIDTADGRHATANFTLPVSAAAGLTDIKAPKLGPIVVPTTIRGGGRKATFKQKATAAPGRKIVFRLWSFKGAGARAAATGGGGSLGNTSSPSGIPGARFGGSLAGKGASIGAKLKSTPKTVTTRVFDDKGNESLSVQNTAPKKNAANCTSKTNHEPVAAFSGSQTSNVTPVWKFDAIDSLPGFKGCHKPKQKGLSNTEGNLKYSWKFDKTVVIPSHRTRTETFPSDGKPHLVTLTVTDEFGKSTVSESVLPAFAQCTPFELNGYEFAPNGCMHGIDLGDHVAYVGDAPVFLDGIQVTLTNNNPSHGFLVVPDHGVLGSWPPDEQDTLRYKRFGNVTETVGTTEHGISVSDAGTVKPDLEPIPRPPGQLQPAGPLTLQLHKDGPATYDGLGFKPPEPFVGAEFPPGIADREPGADYKFSVPDMWFGPVHATGLEFTLHPDNSLTGTGLLSIFGTGGIGASFAFDSQGHFQGAQASFDPVPPVVLTPGFLLTHADGSFSSDPFALGAHAKFESPLSAFGYSLYNIDGCANLSIANVGQTIPNWCAVDGTPSGSFKEPVGGPRVHATGSVHLIGDLIDLAQANFDLDKTQIALHGGINKSLEFPQGVSLASVAANIDAHVGISDPHVEASGDATVCAFDICKGGSVLLSDVGAAACVPIEVGFHVPFIGYVGWIVDMGGWLRWDFSGGGLVFSGCDVHDHGHVAVFKHGLPRFDTALRSRRAVDSPFVAAAAPTFTIKKDLGAEVVAVHGVGHSPRLVIKGPHGVTYTDPGVSKTRGTGAVFLHSDAFAGNSSQVDGNATTYVLLGHPLQGGWKVQTAAGSAPIDGVATALASQRPTVDGTVTGTGDSRELKFDSKSVPRADKVTFVESGPGVAQRIGTTSKAKGKLPFTLAAGPAGQRKVVAIISENGVPRARITVDKFKASAPEHLAAPNIKTAGKGLEFGTSWTGVPGASHYLVTVDLGDGRTRRAMLPGNARSFLTPGLFGGSKAKVTVQAFDSRGVPGKVGIVKVTAPAATADLSY